jgi:hypothetical protein
LGAASFRRVDNRARRLVDNLVIIRPNLDANALFILGGLDGGWVWHGVGRLLTILSVRSDRLI